MQTLDGDSVIINAGIKRENGRTTQSHELLLRWREEVDGEWVRRERRVTDYRPYCFVNPQDFRAKKERVDGRMVECNPPRKIAPFSVENRISDALDWRGGQPAEFHHHDSSGEPYKDAQGNELIRVVLDNPSYLWGLRSMFTPTYEADVPYEDRFLIDVMDEIPEYEMRKVFIDLEALQFRSGEGPEYDAIRPNDPRDNQEISVIGIYDSFSQARIQWCQHGDIEPKTDTQIMDDNPVVVRHFNNERTMLHDFVQWLDDTDPDCLLAWGMGFYDLPTLFRRLESCGIGADKLSPSSLGEDRYVEQPKFKGTQYRWTQQPINGRLVISLDRLFDRIYRDSKSTNLPSNKLDIVGERLFGRGKTEFRPDFYDAGYDEWIDDYLYYNNRDVDLMVDIDQAYNLVEGQQALQQLAKCQFRSTFYGSSYARVYFMRKADFKQRSGWEGVAEEWELQGAIVLDPEELDTVGLHKNVCMLDFAGLYPSIMIAYNTSFETIVPRGQEQSDDIIGDGCRFRRDPMGLLPSCVIELDELRDHYKNLRKEAAAEHGKTSDEYRKWDDAQKTVKRLRATFYGLMAFQGFAWANIDIARTITYGGRTALKQIMGISEELGYKVLYGHTDSIFVGLGDDLTPEECAERAKELGTILTKACQETLKSTAVEVEAEVIMDRFYLPRRNRYAGRIIWDPSLDDPHSIAKLPVDDRIKMQGLEAKHTNTAKVGREAQIESIKLIWDDEEPEVVLNMVKDLISAVRNGERPVNDLIARARLGKWLPSEVDHPFYGMAATNESASPDAQDETDQCYVRLSGNQKGAAWHNLVLSDEVYPRLDRGDSFGYTFVKDGPTWIPTGGYVGFHDVSQIDDYELDLEMIIQKNIVDKLDHIMYGIGLDKSMLLGEKVWTLEDFL